MGRIYCLAGCWAAIIVNAFAFSVWSFRETLVPLVPANLVPEWASREAVIGALVFGLIASIGIAIANMARAIHREEMHQANALWIHGVTLATTMMVSLYLAFNPQELRVGATAATLGCAICLAITVFDLVIHRRAKRTRNRWGAEPRERAGS